MEWARTLAYITGTVDQELLLRNEYLVAENRILKAQLKERLRLSDAERAKLGSLRRGRISGSPEGRPDPGRYRDHPRRCRRHLDVMIAV